MVCIVSYGTLLGICTGEQTMDRRQKKTRDAIFQAFGRLLKKKRFENITVQEIINEADVGRSTFYAHFETKDTLLNAMCTDIFTHVFTQELPEETDTDTIEADKSLKLKLGHILYHLRENRLNIKGLLTSESGELFMHYFKEHLQALFQRYIHEFQVEVPDSFLLHYLVGGFAETVYWWVRQDMLPQPETVAEYYLSVVKRHN